MRSNTAARHLQRTDAHWVAAARAGDRDAFERLAVRAMPRLAGTARRLLGSGFAAEEAVAEALFRAFTRVETFRGEAAFGTWLHRILCRVVGDRFRTEARDRRRRKRWAETCGRPASGAIAPCDRLIASEHDQRLRDAVAGLPARQRLVLLLHVWEGLSLAAIAEVLGIRYATAKSNLCHARAALRRRTS